MSKQIIITRYKEYAQPGQNRKFAWRYMYCFVHPDTGQHIQYMHQLSSTVSYLKRKFKEYKNVKKWELSNVTN